MEYYSSRAVLSKMGYFVASLSTLSTSTAFISPLQTSIVSLQSPVNNKVADSIVLRSTSLSTTQLLLSDNTIIDNSIDTVTSSSSPQVFEAQLPDSSFFIGIGLVVILCIVASQVWANDVVPISRTKLAISKSRGDVKEYLDELKTSNVDSNLDDSSMNETTTITESNDESTTINSSSIDKSNELIKPNVVGDGRDFERWLFSDWLNKPSSKGGRQKEPALPILKEAKWNSGDNPVLVTAAIMMLGVVLASITERVAS